MHFIVRKPHRSISDEIIAKLNQSVKVLIASAYFRPNARTMTALKAVPNLKIIVSDEFTVNDPEKLNELTSKSEIICVPPDDPNGKLHAKVIYGELPDGTNYTFIGSANITANGFTSNQEACLFIDSSHDSVLVAEVRSWLDSLFGKYSSNTFDYKSAKAIAASAHAQSKARVKISPNTWLLKCRDGLDGINYWPKFNSEKVVAIGWRSTSKQGHAPVVMFRDTMKKDDIVLITGGFAPNQMKNLYIYGIARVIGPYRDDASSTWWKGKRDASIQPIEKDVDIGLARKYLGKARHKTIYSINKTTFAAFLDAVHKEYGISVNV